MDVLQLLKTELKERQAELTLLAEGSLSRTLRLEILARLKAYLHLGVSYLLPELNELSPKSEALFARIYADLTYLRDLVASLEGKNEIDQRDIQGLKALFATHSVDVEDRILPLMRQRITTVEREELFHVLQDAKQDLIKAASIELAI